MRLSELGQKRGFGAGVGFKKNGECEDRRKTVLRNVSLHVNWSFLSDVTEESH